MFCVAEQLAAALDGAGDVNELTDGELDDELIALIRVGHRLDACIAERARCWDQRDVWSSDGSRAPWARLSRTASLSPGGAKAVLRRARAIEAMPASAHAWAEGTVGTDHVDLLAAAGAERDELFARDESVLVGNCETLTFPQAAAAITYWRQRADAELDRDGTPPPRPCSLRTRSGADGAVSGEFELDPIGGATVTEALRRIERDLYRADQRDGTVRTQTERMAAALVEMAVRAHSAPTNCGGRSR